MIRFPAGYSVLNALAYVEKQAVFAICHIMRSNIDKMVDIPVHVTAHELTFAYKRA